MIAITAPTGNIGRHLAHLLAGAGIRARLLVRDPSTSSDAHDSVYADLDDPTTLPAALDGVQQLFLLSPGPDTPAQDDAVLQAAAQAGVEHVVLLSSLGVEADGIGGGTAHAPGEELLAEAPVRGTVLRPSEFMTNTLAWLPEIRARETVSIPTGSGRVAAIDPADIAAAVAFRALTRPEVAGRTYRLTGPESLSTADMAAALSDVLGTPIRHRDVTVDEFRAAAEAAAMPAAVVDILAAYYPALARGALDIVSDDVEQVTGHAATTYRAWAVGALTGH